MNENVPVNFTPNDGANLSAVPGAFDDAQRNAMRRVIRCLFAEGILNPEKLVFVGQGHSAIFPIWDRQCLLCFDDLQTAPAQTFVNYGTIAFVNEDGHRQIVRTVSDLLDHLLPSFDFDPADIGAEHLKGDIANSIENDVLARAFRADWNNQLHQAITDHHASGLIDYLRQTCSVRDAAILLDQWGSLEGHPFYPTWKTKPNLTAQEVISLSPEFSAIVPVRVAALRRDMAHLECMAGIDNIHDWFAQNYPEIWGEWCDILRADGETIENWLPLPIHAWHLQNHVQSHFRTEIEDGILRLEGPNIDTRPSMSFRTMLPVKGETTPFIKLPVAIWLTSEMRTLQAKSIHMGPRFSTVISQILADENGFDQTLEMFTEDVGIHYKHAERQDDAEGKHLSVIFRTTNGKLDRDDNLLPVTVASLLTRAPSGDHPLIAELVDGPSGPASQDDVIAFFRDYARVVLTPVIQIYLLYGVALEAHQQNTSILFDPAGKPVRMLIRDFGDGRAYRPLLNERGYDLKSYYYKGILPTIFEDDIEPVRSFVIDACFVCHLHEVAQVLIRHYHLKNDVLWRVMGQETAAAFDAIQKRTGDAHFWQQEKNQFLTQGWSTRSVLRMHLQKYADYRIQHQLPNPMAGGVDHTS